jgi:serine/threonine protein kinase
VGVEDVVADRFELEEEAGSGTMGVVYRARDRLSGLPVALKVLHVASEPRVARFLREARLVAELQHPGLVAYVAHGLLASGAPFLAMAR